MRKIFFRYNFMRVGVLFKFLVKAFYGVNRWISLDGWFRDFFVLVFFVGVCMCVYTCGVCGV